MLTFVPGFALKKRNNLKQRQWFESVVKVKILVNFTETKKILKDSKFYIATVIIMRPKDAITNRYKNFCGQITFSC